VPIVARIAKQLQYLTRKIDLCRKLDRNPVNKHSVAMSNPSMESAVRVLFLLAKEDIHSDLSVLSLALGIAPIAAGRLLDRLEERGLVDAQRVRLTMAGLVVAASMDARDRKVGGDSHAQTLRAIVAA
jgi:DNA-binding MarR family transcriptional regulator